MVCSPSPFIPSPLVWAVLLGAGGTGSQGGWWSWCFPVRGFSPPLRNIFQSSTQFGSWGIKLPRKRLPRGPGWPVSYLTMAEILLCSNLWPNCTHEVLQWDSALTEDGSARRLRAVKVQRLALRLFASNATQAPAGGASQHGRKV